MSALARSVLILVILTAIPAAIFAWNYRPRSVGLEYVDLSSVGTSGGINHTRSLKIQERLPAENDPLNMPRPSHSFYELLNTHRSIEFHFLNAPGFGVERLPPSMQYLGTLVELPDQRLLPHASRDHDLPPESEFTETSMVASDNRTWRQEKLTWHLDNLINVVNFPTREYVEWEQGAKYPLMTRAVSLQPRPFDAHLALREATDIGHRLWRFDDASLVSLLKHRQGAVYVRDILPTMKDLYMTFPTRPLDDFEADAISHLRASGEELFVVTNTNHLRMVGTIRAASQCLACHQVPQGTLLGAFTYRLSRLNLSVPGKVDSASSVPIRASDG